MAFAVFFGLKLAKRLHLPVLVIFESNNFKENLKRLAKFAVPLGIAIGLVIKFGDLFFTEYIPQIVPTAEQIPLWKNLLAAFYGGIVEEILLRLFMVSLLAWILGKIARTTEVAKSNGIMWTAIFRGGGFVWAWPFARHGDHSRA